jgi:hypothetical protein
VQSSMCASNQAGYLVSHCNIIISWMATLAQGYFNGKYSKFSNSRPKMSVVEWALQFPDRREQVKGARAEVTYESSMKGGEIGNSMEISF